MGWRERDIFVARFEKKHLLNCRRKPKMKPAKSAKQTETSLLLLWEAGFLVKRAAAWRLCLLSGDKKTKDGVQVYGMNHSFLDAEKKGKSGCAVSWFRLANWSKTAFGTAHAFYLSKFCKPARDDSKEPENTLEQNEQLSIWRQAQHGSPKGFRALCLSRNSYGFGQKPESSGYLTSCPKAWRLKPGFQKF